MRPNLRRCAFTLLELVVVIAVLALVAALVIGKYTGVKDHAGDTVARAALQAVREAFTGSASGPGYVSDMKRLPGFPLTGMKVADLLVKRDAPGYLEYDPVTQRGWRGPYLENPAPVPNTNTARNGTFPAANERRFAQDPTFLERHFYTNATTSPYGTAGDPAAADPWGNPMVLQVPGDDAFSTPTTAKRILYMRLVSAGPDGVLDTPLDRTAGMLSDGTTSARGDDLVLFLNRTDVYEDEP